MTTETDWLDAFAPNIERKRGPGNHAPAKLGTQKQPDLLVRIAEFQERTMREEGGEDGRE